MGEQNLIGAKISGSRQLVSARRKFNVLCLFFIWSVSCSYSGLNVGDLRSIRDELALFCLIALIPETTSRIRLFSLLDTVPVLWIGGRVFIVNMVRKTPDLCRRFDVFDIWLNTATQRFERHRDNIQIGCSSFFWGKVSLDVSALLWR